MWSRKSVYISLLFINTFHRSMTMSNQANNVDVTLTQSFYELRPLKIGVEAFGINLQTDPPPVVIEQIKKDVSEHRIVVFRNQGNISGQRQVDISRWFGELESTFYKHPKSPHPDVFRVSNDKVEGCTGVGRTGWHIDGSFQHKPFGYSLYHIVDVPQQGDTVFVGMTEVIEALSDEQRQRWEHLWMVSERGHGPVHPLIYSHPITGKSVMCFHLGMIDGFKWDYGSGQEKWASEQDTMQVLNEIYNEIVKKHADMQYHHKWTAGDFIISDNLAVAHEASPETQLPREKVGLRVMHRTTVNGHAVPEKVYNSKDEL